MPSKPSYSIEPIRGAIGGMDWTSSIDAIADNRARYIQDAWVNEPPLLNRRGPIATPDSVVYNKADRPMGFATTLNPAGDRVSVAIRAHTAIEFAVFSADLTSITRSFDVGPSFVSAFVNPNFDAKPMLGGGYLFGVSDGFTFTTGSSSSTSMFMWRGGQHGPYQTGTATSTVGSKTVTGSGTSWSANVSPGMFVLNNANNLIGVVFSVDSNTQITLEQPAAIAISAAAYTIQTVRGFNPRIASGVINVASGATSVTGADTAFLDEGVVVNARLYKAADYTFIGTVSATPTDNYALTLSSGATVAMNGEEYFIINASPDYTTSVMNTSLVKPGMHHAVYAGRQWYANRPVPDDAGGSRTQRVWFSDPNNPENVNMSPTKGSYITVGDDSNNEPIIGLAATRSALVVFKPGSTWGIFGDSPDNFSVKKISEDGCLATMTVANRGDGIIWAGKNGLWSWDGVEPENLLDGTMQDYWVASFLKYNYNNHRAWGTVYRDHYLFSSDFFTPPAPLRKNFNQTPASFGLSVYLPTKGASLLSNFAFRASAHLPSSTGYEDWYMVQQWINNSVNPDFETNITGWAIGGVGTTLSRDTTLAYHGTASMQIAAGSVAGGCVASSNESLASQGVFVQPSVWVYSPTGGEQVRIGFDEYQTITFKQTTFAGFQTLVAGWNKVSPGPLAAQNASTTAVRTRLETPANSVLNVDDFRIYRVSPYLTTGSWNAIVCDFAKLFDTQGFDIVQTGMDDWGPDFYFESRGLDAQDPGRRKRFKILIGNWNMNALGTNSITDVLRISTVKGFEETGVMVSTGLPSTLGVFTPKRVKVSVPTQVFRFRVWQPSARISKVVMGPLDVAYSMQRIGRT